jgi:hypothetical protein
MPEETTKKHVKMETAYPAVFLHTGSFSKLKMENM